VRVPANRAGSTRIGRRQRLLALFLGASAAVALTLLALARLLDDVKADALSVGHTIVPLVLETLARPPEPGVARVVFLGDSTAIRRSRSRGVPERLARQLTRRRARARVDALTYRGLGNANYYYLADRIAAADPDLVVLPVNFREFRHEDLPPGRPEIAGLLAPGRLPDALSLLARLRVPADHLLLYVGLIQAGALEPWHWLAIQQARADALWRRVQRATLSGRSPSPDEALRAAAASREAERWIDPVSGRYHEAGARRAYGPALSGVEADHPALVVLSATLARYADASVPVLVYAVPLNLERMRDLGVPVEPGLERTVARLSETVESHGARFVDLHDMLPDGAFTDQTHFDTPPPVDGLERVASALALEVAAALSRPDAPNAGRRPRER